MPDRGLSANERQQIKRLSATPPPQSSPAESSSPDGPPLPPLRTQPFWRVFRPRLDFSPIEVTMPQRSSRHAFVLAIGLAILRLGGLKRHSNKCPVLRLCLLRDKQASDPSTTLTCRLPGQLVGLGSYTGI
ncbi:hypothetical protein LY78DRAFT_658834 [Colletotrichum sublineola]|nr:hypothetical protein LY78DRAFT_658834 [Colletotrichum sublineola]